MGSCATPSWLRRDEDDVRSLAGELFAELEKDKMAVRENDMLVVDFNTSSSAPRGPPNRPPNTLRPPAERVKWSDSFIAIAEEFGIELDDEPIEERADSHVVPHHSTRIKTTPDITSEVSHTEENQVLDSTIKPSVLPAPVSLSPQRAIEHNHDDVLSWSSTPDSTKKTKRRESLTSTLSHADYFQKIMGVSVSAMSRSPVLKVGRDRLNALQSPATPSRLQEFDLNATRVSPVSRNSPIQQAREGLLHSNMASAEPVVPFEPQQPPEDISQFSQISASSRHPHRHHHKRRRSHSGERGLHHHPAARKRRRQNESQLTPAVGTPEVKEELLSGTSLDALDSQFDSQFDSSGVEGATPQLTPVKSSGTAPSQFVDSQGWIGRWSSSTSELRMRAHSQRLKATRAPGPKPPSGVESDEELLNDALQLVAKLEGECRYKQRALAKTEAKYRTQAQELRKICKRRDTLKKKAVGLQRRILATAAAAAPAKAT